MKINQTNILIFFYIFVAVAVLIIEALKLVILLLLDPTLKLFYEDEPFVLAMICIV